MKAFDKIKKGFEKEEKKGHEAGESKAVEKKEAMAKKMGKK